MPVTIQCKGCGHILYQGKDIVIIGRAYNTYDEAMTLNIPEKLRDMSVLAIPLDFLPLRSLAGEVIQAHPNMYWKSGQKILCAARMIARDPRLFGLYVTNFACGPDSYLLKFFKRFYCGDGRFGCLTQFGDFVFIH
jgi:predicted nucleotide-binding protein (sugar kinase/HSP70/actin superfamily)